MENQLKKTPSEQGENQQQTPATHMWHRADIEPRPHWWEVSVLTNLPANPAPQGKKYQKSKKKKEKKKRQENWLRLGKIETVYER